jgi:hypothetical protein
LGKRGDSLLVITAIQEPEDGQGFKDYPAWTQRRQWPVHDRCTGTESPEHACRGTGSEARAGRHRTEEKVETDIHQNVMGRILSNRGSSRSDCETKEGSHRSSGRAGAIVVSLGTNRATS